MKCPDCNQEMLGGRHCFSKPCSRASEHRERARKLRELANVAQSRSEQARLNSRSEMFDAFARVVEQATTSEQFDRFTSCIGAVSFGLGTAAQVARHRDRLDGTHPRRSIHGRTHRRRVGGHESRLFASAHASVMVAFALARCAVPPRRFKGVACQSECETMQRHSQCSLPK